MKNSDIREAARKNGVFLYEIAGKLCISEPTMTRLMRNELNEEKRAEILNAITALAAEKSASKA